MRPPAWQDSPSTTPRWSHRSLWCGLQHFGQNKIARLLLHLNIKWTQNLIRSYTCEQEIMAKKEPERDYRRSVWAGLTEHPDHLSPRLWIGTGPGSSETDWTPRSSPAEASYSDITNMQSTVPQHQWLVTIITCSWCHWSSLTLSSARALSPFLSPSVSAATQEIQNGTNE